MKRKILTLIIICLVTKIFAMEHNQVTYTFKPLEEDETVVYEIIDNKLELYKYCDDERNFYFSFKNLPLRGGFQISGDRKNVIYYGWEHYGDIDDTVAYYIIDGQKGEIRYLTNLPFGGKTSSDLNYIVFAKMDAPNIIDIYIHNLKTFELEKTLCWKTNCSDIKNGYEKNPDFQIIRDKNKKNGFHIYMFGEGGGIYEDAYFTINDFEVKSNKEINWEKKLYHIFELEFSDYELGK